LDAAIGLAVHTTLPPATGFATVDLKVTYLRPMTKDSGPVLAEGVVIHSGKRIVASEAKLVDCNGKLCAHATAHLPYLPFREQGASLIRTCTAEDFDNQIVTITAGATANREMRA
jgi:acyl-coenzyme A thioesterase PaaI-like protein